VQLYNYPSLNRINAPGLALIDKGEGGRVCVSGVFRNSFLPFSSYVLCGSVGVLLVLLLSLNGICRQYDMNACVSKICKMMYVHGRCMVNSINQGMSAR
jgi:hypothetical protein